MLNIGGGELLLILLVALVVLGPDKLPDAARQAGRVVNEFRRISSGFQTELRNAMKDPVAAALEERQIPSPDPMAAYVRQEEEKQARAAEEAAADADEAATDVPDSPDAGATTGESTAPDGITDDATPVDAASAPDSDVPTDPEAGIPSDR